MVREKVLGVLLLSTVIALGMTISCSAAHAEPFDKPLQKKVVDLGLSPELRPSAKGHTKLTCSYYPNFMVKELNDPGNKGALFISIVPSRSRHLSGCTRRHGPEEKVFKDWSGYFGGVKRDLVFLFAADGDNEGVYFSVFDSKTMAKLFTDSVWLLHEEIDFVRTSDTQMALRYLRVVNEHCSVPKDGSACWSKFKEQSGLRVAPMPACDYHGEDVTEPSNIAYPVEVSLFPKPSITALANPVKCWPSD